MKKFVVFVLIALIALSTVCAASETHTLKIKANVAEVLPAFQLLLLAPADVYTTNSGAVVFTDAASYNALDTTTAKNVNFQLDEGGTAHFQVNLANLAKTNKSFVLAFSGGTFAAKKNGEAYSRNPSAINTSKGANVASIYTITRSGTDGEGNQDITVSFHGKTVTTKDVALATADYIYPADPDIDPNTEAEPYYFADVVLTVTVS